ncbi:hypothetical protein P5P86_16180 [Nocardioides sp. BP30]|uniref:hypothetical protein n=1 Tax=Nocardioides sp. BP30 TaxID=3036374 RepID=UPI0024695375|nr:hypothetical protein [Nocardioides sp. BP30]WGL51492.1 hypothetical protein P5P86_16180 [Nocardioides sp. BP30]
MNTSPRRVIIRATALALLATTALLAVVAELGPSVDLGARQQFAVLLGQWCTLVLLGCAGWAWLITMLVLTEAARGATAERLRPRRPGVPSAYRRLVLAACGLVLSAGAGAPALATPGPVHLGPAPAAAGAPAALPAPPARAPVASISRVDRQHHADSDPIAVHVGDSLWRLTAERLSPDADDATIDHAWRRLYAANVDLIGSDPDRIEPGQLLDRPRGW